MSKVYILMGLGFGDEESAYEPLGVYTSKKKAQAAQKSIVDSNIPDEDDDNDTVDLEFRIDVYTLDADPNAVEDDEDDE